MNFKKRYTLEERKRESQKIIRKYPDRIPVIVETNSDDLVLDKSKYLVPKDITMGQFLFVIRKRLKLAPEEGLYLFVDNTLVSISAMLSEIYAKHRDEDSYVYFTVCKESTFGMTLNP